MSSTSMKQSKQSQLPKQIKSATKSAITKAERIHILNKQGKAAILNTAQKKKFFHSLLERKADIMEHAHSLDSSGNTKNLVPTLRLIIPETVTNIEKDWRKEVLTDRFLQLHQPFELMANKLHQQHRIEAAAKPFTRQQSKTNQNTESQSVLSLYEEVIEVVRNIDQEVIHMRTEELYDKYTKVKLTPIQRSRKWNKDRVPVAANLMICVMCKHQSTNLPIENDETNEANRAMLVKYEKNVKEWDKYKAEVSKGNTPSTKPPRPTKRTYKHPIIQCMCATSFCVSIMDDNTNNCPIKCLKPSNNNINEKERYLYEGSPIAVCSCPVCTCKCSFACTLDDLPALTFATTLANSNNIPNFDNQTMNSNQPNSNEQHEVNSSISSTTIFNDSVGDGVQLGFSFLQSELKKQQNKSTAASSSFSSSARNKHTLLHQTKSIICEHAAVNIAKMSCNISQADRLKMQKASFPLTTKVVLPGASIDTRALMQQGQHGRNNRLGTLTEGVPLPGMLDNSRINYTTVTPEYKREYNRLFNLKNESTSGTGVGDDSSGVYDLTFSGSEEDNVTVPNDNHIAVVNDGGTKDESILDDTESAVVKMSGRMMG